MADCLTDRLMEQPGLQIATEPTTVHLESVEHHSQPALKEHVSQSPALSHCAAGQSVGN
jgi:hypothetical protein